MFSAFSGRLDVEFDGPLLAQRFMNVGHELVAPHLRVDVVDIIEDPKAGIVVVEDHDTVVLCQVSPAFVVLFGGQLRAGEGTVKRLSPRPRVTPSSSTFFMRLSRSA